MSTDTLLLFIVASFAMAATPGPTMLMALSNGVTGGLRAASFGILGAVLGASILVLAVALGLGALLATSEAAFQVVRVFGVAYLAWMGWRMWRSDPLDMRPALAGAPQLRGRVAFARSLMVALSNPKTMLFFAAFLPQFVDTSAPQGPQFALLGAIFVSLDACLMLAYATLGGQAVRWLSERALRGMNRGCACGMWLLALTMAVWRRPGT